MSTTGTSSKLLFPNTVVYILYHEDTPTTVAYNIIWYVPTRIIIIDVETTYHV